MHLEIMRRFQIQQREMQSMVDRLLRNDGKRN